VIPLGVAVKRCFRALRLGEIVCLLGDWDIAAEGMLLPFFRREARVPRGPSAMAAKTGAAVVPGFAIRQADNRFRLYLEPAIWPGASGGSEDNVVDLARRLLAVLEKYIRRFPEQWYMYHRIWGDGSLEGGRATG